MRTRIRGRYVVAYDATSKGHVVVPDGEVVFEGDRILHAGGPYQGDVNEEIDARECLVMPGLIDIHALMDVGIHLLLSDRQRDPGYRPRQFLDLAEPVFTQQQTREGAEATFYLMLRSGVTTFCGITAMVFKRWHDPDWEPEIYAQTANRYGLRAFLSHHYRAGVTYLESNGNTRWLWDEPRGFEGLERNIEFVRRSQRGDYGDRVHGLLFPYTADSQTPDLLRATRQAADELGVGIRMHFAQSQAELDETLRRYNRTPVEQLVELGVLGPDVLLTHCLYGRGYQGRPGLDDMEVSLLAQAGASVASTPWVYTFRGGLLNSFGRYQRAGINMCIGTDTYPNDMLREMQYAAVMGKMAEESPTAVTAADVFNAATLNAARYLGREDLGRLAAGAKADIVIVRADRLTFAPTFDPIRSLIYYSNLRDVTSVIIDGCRVMQDGQVYGVDETQLRQQVEAVLSHMGRTFEGWDHRGRPFDRRFGPSFPLKGGAKP